jgi:hypothetical protein
VTEPTAPNLRARSCPTCHSIGEPRTVDRTLGGNEPILCRDPWHQPTPELRPCDGCGALSTEVEGGLILVEIGVNVGEEFGRIDEYEYCDACLVERGPLWWLSFCDPDIAASIRSENLSGSRSCFTGIRQAGAWAYVASAGVLRLPGTAGRRRSTCWWCGGACAGLVVAGSGQP